jgi:hypothetical protein
LLLTPRMPSRFAYRPSPAHTARRGGPWCVVAAAVLLAAAGCAQPNGWQTGLAGSDLAAARPTAPTTTGVEASPHEPWTRTSPPIASVRAVASSKASILAVSAASDPVAARVAGMDAEEPASLRAAFAQLNGPRATARAPLEPRPKRSPADTLPDSTTLSPAASSLARTGRDATMERRGGWSAERPIGTPNEND